jgi:hypothetical protein
MSLGSGEQPPLRDGGLLDYYSFTVSDLTEHLRVKGLSTTGRKHILAARLLLDQIKWDGGGIEDYIEREELVGGWMKLNVPELREKLITTKLSTDGTKKVGVLRLAIDAKKHDQKQAEKR